MQSKFQTWRAKIERKQKSEMPGGNFDNASERKKNEGNIDTNPHQLA